MPVSLGLAGAGVLVGGVQSIIGASQASSAKKNLLNQINNQSVYQPSQYAQQALAEAQARENAKSAGVTYGENMALKGLANQYANTQRNASSGAQALGMGAVGQANYNQAITDLGQVQNQYNQQAIQNTNAARGGMINEQEKAFNSLRAKQDAMQNLYAGQMGAGNAMLGQGLGTVASGLIGAAGAYNGGGGSGTKGSPVEMSSISGKTTMPNFNSSVSGPSRSNFQKTNYPTFPPGTFNFW
jgi:predicted transcriptional regulator